MTTIELSSDSKLSFRTRFHDHIPSSKLLFGNQCGSLSYAIFHMLVQGSDNCFYVQIQHTKISFYMPACEHYPLLARVKAVDLFKKQAQRYCRSLYCHIHTHFVLSKYQVCHHTIQTAGSIWLINNCKNKCKILLLDEKMSRQSRHLLIDTLNDYIINTFNESFYTTFMKMILSYNTKASYGKGLLSCLKRR